MTVTVYTKPDCVQCKYTIKELVAKDVPHTTIDVTQDQAARKYLEDLGLRTMPVVEVKHKDGKMDRWKGFHIEKLRGLSRDA